MCIENCVRKKRYRDRGKSFENPDRANDQLDRSIRNQCVRYLFFSRSDIVAEISQVDLTSCYFFFQIGVLLAIICTVCAISTTIWEEMVGKVLQLISS